MNTPSAPEPETRAADPRPREPRPRETQRIRIEQHSAVGLLWFGGWLFTLGYLDLAFWRGVLAIVLWPFYLGATFSPME